MDGASLALSIVSLLTAFKGALDGIVFLAEVWSGFDDASFYHVKLGTEQERLRSWGDLYGLGDDATAFGLEAQSEHHRDLIKKILIEI